jgi:hypothetical protein
VQSAVLLMVAAVVLFPCFNGFAGLVVLHTYLAMSAQTTYEISKGAKVTRLSYHIHPCAYVVRHTPLLYAMFSALASIVWKLDFPEWSWYAQTYGMVSILT